MVYKPFSPTVKFHVNSILFLPVSLNDSQILEGHAHKSDFAIVRDVFRHKSRTLIHFSICMVVFHRAQTLDLCDTIFLPGTPTQYIKPVNVGKSVLGKFERSAGMVIRGMGISYHRVGNFNFV